MLNPPPELNAPAASPSDHRPGAISKLAVWVTTARGWRHRALTFAAGAISTLAFAPFFAWPVLFLTFPFFVWLADGAATDPRPIRATALAWWWFGFGYFFTGMIWIGEAFLVEAEIFAWLLPFAVTLLPAGLALFWALAGGVAAKVWPARPRSDLAHGIARVLIVAVTIGCTEWLRGHTFTGLPWNTPGIALTMPLPLMQAASVFGIYGLTLWAVFICTLPGVALGSNSATKDSAKYGSAVILAGVPLLVAYGFGAWHLSMPESPELNGVKIRIVQPSIPQRDKWIGEKQPAIFAEHLNLSKQNEAGEIDNLANISHVIWPEAAMPFGPLDHPEALSAIGQLLPQNVILLTGALRQERNELDGTRKAYNSLMALGANGSLVGLYDKIHLVPFGEYLPFQSTLEALGLQSLTRQRGGFAKGPAPKAVMIVPGLPKIAPMICYEAIFPNEVAQSADRPGLILIVTNDGWFGNSTGPYQHFHQARIRAVEQGLPVVRAANNGISGVIDPEGRILRLISLNERSTSDSTLPAKRLETVYARWGDSVFWLNLLIFAGTFRWFLRCNPSRGSAIISG
ncbi:MAG: apolipoprotein N-acyltransferase [Hyphomicrobiaceae bacterium]